MDRRREFSSSSAALLPRSKRQGNKADLVRADHVDILGSTPLNAAILKIAAGRYDLVPQKIGSRILEYVEKMRWD